MEAAKQVYVKPHDFGTLPEIVLIKIFQYLPIVDLVQAGRVCSLWYKVHKEQRFWKHITLNDLEPDQIDLLFQSLPKCVSYLKIKNSLEKRPVSMLTRHCGPVLKNKCPNLEILLIENYVLLPDFEYNKFDIDCLPSYVHTISFQGSIVKPKIFFKNKDKCKNITVIDFSFCLTIRDHDLVFLRQMENLKELYLAGCLVDDQTISKLFILDFRPDDTIVNLWKDLKVLDLESTQVTDCSVLYLQCVLHSLEKLYLAKTNVTFQFSLLGENIPTNKFRNLIHLCIKHIEADFRYLSYVVKWQSVEYIDVISDDIIKTEVSAINEPYNAKFRFHDEIKTVNCDHFTKNLVV